MVCVPLAAQQRGDDEIWFSIPFGGSLSFGFGDFLDPDLGEDPDLAALGLDDVDVRAEDFLLANVLFRTDFDAAFGVFFPIPNTSLSIGPEIGVSLPIFLLLGNTLALHIPVRAVLNIPLTERISVDALVGTEFNFIARSSNMTFDLGARIDFSGFLVGVMYTMPFSVVFADAERELLSPKYWENALTITIGGRIKI